MRNARVTQRIDQLLRTGTPLGQAIAQAEREANPTTQAEPRCPSHGLPAARCVLCTAMVA